MRKKIRGTIRDLYRAIPAVTRCLGLCKHIGGKTYNDKSGAQSIQSTYCYLDSQRIAGCISCCLILSRGVGLVLQVLKISIYENKHKQPDFKLRGVV